MSLIDVERIASAADRLAGKIHRTPLLSTRTLGEKSGVDLFLKCECLQKTGSFKSRGALNKVLSLSPEDRARGLITVSAGNHAQAVAWAARQVNAPCAVVMPSDAPQAKLDAVRGYGAEVILHPDRSLLFERLREEEEARGSTFIHPFDDPVVLAGAGTQGLEILEDLPDVDVIVVPVGGGGLMAGVASAIKGSRPRVKMVAVELEAGPGLGPALAAGKPVTVTRPKETVADGMAPPFVGEIALSVAQKAVDQVVTVTETEITQTMVLILERTKLLVEGSGAAATAAVLCGKIDLHPGAKVVAVVSGGNVDLARVAKLIQT